MDERSSGMPVRTSIRRQLILYFVAFAVILGGLFAVVTLVVFHRVEDRMMSRRLEQMLAERPGASERDIVTYVGTLDAAPPSVRERLTGRPAGHYEWEDSGGELHALVRRRPEDGGVTVATARFPESELAERGLGIALGFAVFATSLIALFLARYLARRIVSPIERLTDRLEAGPMGVMVPDAMLDEPGAAEVGMLARALHDAGRALIESSEREGRFLREASHELRTPITVIQGVSDLLRESVPADDRLTRERLDRLGRSLRRMNVSVLSLLAMARTEHRQTVGGLPPFRQQLQDVVDETRNLANPGVEVTCTHRGEEPSGVAGAMLIVALSNLARNAAEHTEAGLIRIAIESGVASVRDDGSGLAPGLAGQLVGEGPQPDLGIGLATVSRICRRLGWRLEVERPAAGGTKVRIWTRSRA